MSETKKPKQQLSSIEVTQRDIERGLAVSKSDAMIQKARFTLTVQEQRAVLYAISKIKPEDTGFSEYTFEIKDFYKVIGWEKESYTEFKAMLKGLSDRSWWAEIDEDGTESLLRWFSTVRSNKRSGKVTVKFHEDMVPFLLRLAANNEFHTTYYLKYVLPMNSQYSPRLYEILKSYQKNNKKWWFDVDQLKWLLDATNYRWVDFKRRALDPAVEEINKYTDIRIGYQIAKNGRKVERIYFFMDGKTNRELAATNQLIEEELDGKQTSLFDADPTDEAYYAFLAERELQRAEDAAADEKRKEILDAAKKFYQDK